MNNNQLALSLNEPLKKQLRNKVEAFVKSNQFPTDINAQNKLIETQVKSLLENQIISLGPESKKLNKLKQEITNSIKTKIQAYSESKDIRFERDEKQEKGIAEEIKLFYLLANHSEREAFLEETRAETYPQLKNIKVSDLIDSFSKQGEQDTSIKKQDNLTTRLWFADTGRDDPRNEDFENSVPNFKKQISMVNAFLDSSSELDPASKQKTKNLLSEFTGLQDISHYDSLAGYNATELKTQYPYLNPRQGKWIESNLSTERFGPFGLISSLARFAADTLIGRQDPPPNPDVAHATTPPVQEISDPSKDYKLPQGTFGQHALKESNLVTYQIKDANSPLNGQKLYFRMPSTNYEKQLFSKMAKRYGLGETDVKKWILSEIYKEALNSKQNNSEPNYNPLADKVRSIVSTTSGDAIEMLNLAPLFQGEQEIPNSFLLGASSVESFRRKYNAHEAQANDLGYSL